MPSLAALRALLGTRLSENPYDCQSHGRDENYPESRPPLAVVFAESREDIRATLAWASAEGIAVIPYGAGTSLEGHLIPQGDAISLDLSRMQRVVEILPDDFLVVVEPGITRTALNVALRDTGLFFPVDPGADASIGGMAATNASGTTTVRYGGMRQNVVALEVMLANGETMRLGRRVRKTSSGYDLKDLFLGSGGTLGIITEITLRLHPIPAYVHAARLYFPSLAAATQAAYQIMASALPVARMELLDELSLRLVNLALGRQDPEQPALFVEFHSSTLAAMDEERQMAEEIAHDAGAIAIASARTAEERNSLWEARHRLYWSLVQYYPGRTYVITDTAVPLAHLTELVSYAQAVLAEIGLEGCILGHVGDGNFHTLIAAGPAEMERARDFNARLVHRALELGGTASGEHGIGLAKRPYLEAEHGAALGWMRRIKDLFDPDHILNPGKVI